MKWLIEHRDEWVSYCSHVDDATGSQACNCAPELIDVVERLDGIEQAARVWLRFDNEVEPPHSDAPYAEHLAYESAKFAITEAVAQALHDRGVA